MKTTPMWVPEGRVFSSLRFYRLEKRGLGLHLMAEMCVLLVCAANVEQASVVCLGLLWVPKLLRIGQAGSLLLAMDLCSLNKDRPYVTTGTAGRGGQHDLNVTEARRSVRGGIVS